MRSRVSPKLPIARAAMPMFSPSCGSTRITTGPASVTPDLVLSVPEPDLSLLFLIQPLKVLNQVLKNLIQRLIYLLYSIACPAEFLKQYNWLRDVSESSIETSNAPSQRRLRAFGLRIGYQPQPKRTCKNQPEGRFNGSGIWGGFHAPQLVTGDCRTDSHPPPRLAGPSDANLRPHPDPRCAVPGRQGQHHERPALHPAERVSAESRPRRSRSSRLHQFPCDPGWLSHRIPPPRLRGARPRPDRPRLQRSACLRRRICRGPRGVRPSP